MASTAAPERFKLRYDHECWGQQADLREGEGGENSERADDLNELKHLTTSCLEWSVVVLNRVRRVSSGAKGRFKSSRS